MSAGTHRTESTSIFQYIHCLHHKDAIYFQKCREGNKCALNLLILRNSKCALNERENNSKANKLLTWPRLTDQVHTRLQCSEKPYENTLFLYLLRLLSLLLDLLWSRERLHLLSDVLLECLLRERLLLRLSLSRALSFSFSSSSRLLFLSRSSLSRSLSFSLSSRSCFSFFNLSSRSGSSVLFRNFSFKISPQEKIRTLKENHLT